MSSPRRFSSFSFRWPFCRAYRLSTLVRAFLKPSSCMPPSVVAMLFGERVDALVVAGVPLHRDLDLAASSTSPRDTTLSNSGSLDALRWRTKSTMPPSYLKICSTGSSGRSSRNTISRPRLRNAISRRRSTSVCARNSSSSKIVGSGQNVTDVPVLRNRRPPELGPSARRRRRTSARSARRRGRSRARDGATARSRPTRRRRAARRRSCSPRRRTCRRRAAS